ncbi:hypothetical protein PC9H_001585 [Pleurotus ostreatus]|uniref:Polysaccharide lyase 14 domain-containing protein n=1 Tax=Pleurotus ostreatus TaxID=5322 RepID=A0A8H7A768_PLEOS|nr:uncharacterized protein PC9H_001585 [Pleurotus ostreatus]KAF7441236.1 hypothetical protein PC9H_001585 [Pleurotus ostreatus]KAJ8699252.1 hypothetical protein PTI98_002384 [Pleurotus ostreatus]
MSRSIRLVLCLATAEALLLIPADSPADASSQFLPPTLTSSLLLATSSGGQIDTTIVTETVQYQTTVFEVVTDTVFSSSSPSTPTPTTESTYPALPSPSNGTSWSAPADMIDLSSFKVTYFPAGWQNVELVSGIPATASATGTALSAESTASTPSWDNSSSILQLMYPAGSINPASQPQGGAEFYASPLKGMTKAQQMVLTYSVFFPVDFDWVRGGKLPGLYGGREHCSGGVDATDCFSTRMMWRQGGAGELYLYAPKDKQTSELCGDNQSVCESTYGLSIGRGSFNFNAGSWTHLKQTVTLNRPGKPDGYFALDVDGKRVIERSDIYYRGMPAPTKTIKKPVVKKPEQGGGLLGPILGGILPKRAIERRSLRIVPGNQAVMTSDDSMEVSTENVDDEGPMLLAGQADSSEPVGFIGLFFSTFFGGHEQKFATPRDQYAWFKDFSMSY